MTKKVSKGIWCASDNIPLTEEDKKELLFMDKVYKDCFLLKSLNRKSLEISELTSDLVRHSGYRNHEDRLLPDEELIQKFDDLVQIFLQIQKQGDV